MVIACGDDDVDLNLSAGTSDAGTDSGKKAPTTGDAGEDAAAIDPVEGEVKTYAVGGSVTGLTAGTLVLTNNNGDDLSLTADGAFVFATPVADTTGYAVAVKTQPAGLICAATAATGTLAGTNVTSVVVTCQKGFKVGGTITGLVGTGLVLKNNGGDTLAVAADATTFTFAGLVATTGPYDVSVSASPAEQTCTVTKGGSGTIANADYAGAEIECTVTRYELGGKVAGLFEGANVTLVNNADPDDTFAFPNGDFKLPKTHVKDDAFDVKVQAENHGTTYTTQACTVTGGSGTFASANVTNIAVACSATKICGNGVENQAFTLTCPAGQVITSIDFASYGTPTGECGGYAVSETCNSASSMQIITGACLGNASCTVRGNNGDGYGDPCSGTVKHTSVQATCGAAPLLP